MKKFKRFFCWHKIYKHPVYVLSEYKNYYTFIMLTHASKWKYRKKNIPLSYPIDRNDTKKNYIVPQICVDDKENFSEKVKYSFSRKDGYKIRDLVKIIRGKVV